MRSGTEHLSKFWIPFGIFFLILEKRVCMYLDGVCDGKDGDFSIYRV